MGAILCLGRIDCVIKLSFFSAPAQRRPAIDGFGGHSCRNVRVWRPFSNVLPRLQLYRLLLFKSEKERALETYQQFLDVFRNDFLCVEYVRFFERQRRGTGAVKTVYLHRQLDCIFSG